MKSPKSLNSGLNHATKKTRQSSFLLWAVLIMVMLSGLVYLGSRVKALRMLQPQVPVNKLSKSPLQASSELTPDHLVQSVPLSFEKILILLKSQQLINPVIYTSQMMIKNDETPETAQNHDALWQAGQKQLTMIKATVYAGVDLSELVIENLSTKKPVTLYLPPARISLIQIDNVTMYDVKTGQPSTVQLGLSLSSDQDKNIKAQVEREFCQSDVLQTAAENTRQHVISMLDTMGVSMIVRVAEPLDCQQAAS